MNVPGVEGASANSEDLQLFESGILADATVVGGGREWKVHRAILASRSKWFQKAFCGEMIEATTGKVALQEKNADLIDIVLRFIYPKETRLSCLKDAKDVPVLCVKIFRIADFFMLEDLKQRATEGLINYLKTLPTIADTETGDGQCPDWVTEVLEGVQEAYMDESTGPVVDTMLEFVYPKMRQIFRLKGAMDYVDATPGLARDLVKKHVFADTMKEARDTSFRTGPQICATVQQGGREKTNWSRTKIAPMPHLILDDDDDDYDYRCQDEGVEDDDEDWPRSKRQPAKKKGKRGKTAKAAAAARAKDVDDDEI